MSAESLMVSQSGLAACRNADVHAVFLGILDDDCAGSDHAPARDRDPVANGRIEPEKAALTDFGFAADAGVCRDEAIVGDLNMMGYMGAAADDDAVADPCERLDNCAV